MDDLLVDRRSMFRIGVMITAMSAMVLSVAVGGPVDGGGLWWLTFLIVALLSVTGVGLLFGALFARILGGLLFLGGVVFSPISLIQALDLSSTPGSLDLGWLLSVGNAVATMLLLVWLCVRAIQVLLGTTRRTSAVTARLAGGALAVIAANHLWLATQIGFGWQGSWAVNISPRGAQFVGFLGWPIWHLAVLLAALVLLVGPRRILGGAAAALMLLFAGMVPLVIIAAARTGFFELQLLPLLAGMVLLPVYLLWWLRDELRGLSTPPDHAAAASREVD
jgi:hypothetical protein